MSIVLAGSAAFAKILKSRFSVPIILLGILGAAAVPREGLAACDIFPRAYVHTSAQTGQVAVTKDLSLDQITALAKEIGKTRNAAVLGFYIGRFQHQASATVETGPEARCTKHLRIEIDLQLIDRRIQVGRELLQQPCLLYAAVNHYEKKASADETVFARYVDAIAATLNSTPVLDDFAPIDEPGEVAIRRHAEQRVEALVDQSLPSLKSARNAAQLAVDTPEEMRLLGEACRKAAY